MLRNIFHIIHLWFQGGRSIKYINYCEWLRKQGVKVGENVYFRSPEHTLVDITRPSLVEFGNNLDINDNFCVLTHDFSTFVFRGLYGDFVNSSGKVIIGNNIVFGRNVTILKGVTIGDNCIIGLGSVITKSIPANSVVAGCPAKIICTLEEFYKKRKEKCLEEAMEYGMSLLERKGELIAEDFTEEWSLFLTKDDYLNNPRLRKNVDFRMKKYVPIEKVLSEKRPFDGFDDFKKAIINLRNDKNENYQ